VDDGLQLTHLGNILCSIPIGGISVSGPWPSTGIEVLHFPIDPGLVLANICAVVYLVTPMVVFNLEDDEL